MSVNPDDVTACLVTRGNVDMQPILDSLPYPEVVVWDNSKSWMDLRVFGRYEAAQYAKTDFIYFQDDDVIFTEHQPLLEAAQPNMFVSNNAHGPNHGGYNDLVLQAAGAIIPKAMIHPTWKKWFQHYPWEMQDIVIRRAEKTIRDGLLWEADFIFGVLCERWKQIDLPYERLYADDNSRLCRQSWQEDLKLHMTTLAREIRDGKSVPVEELFELNEHTFNDDFPSYDFVADAAEPYQRLQSP